MDRQINGTALITSYEELLEYIHTYCFMDSIDNVFFTGNNIGHLLNPLVNTLGEDTDMSHICIMIPSLTAHGTLFRSHAGRAGAQIRVTNRAVHDMIVKKNVFFLISYIASNNLKSPLLGIVSTQGDLCKQAMNSVQAMWERGHQLKSNGN